MKAGVCEDDIEFTPLFSEPIDRALGRFDIEGVAIADLMKEVGLTVGGFYNRFDSRDDLVLEALRAASGPWQKQVLAAESGGPPLTYESLIDSYLSESHRDHPGNGCPIGALACDIGRGSKHIRSFLNERVKSHFELLSNLLPQDDSNQKKIVVPKKVLVTGASGLLGVAAIGKFLSAGWDVVGVSRRKPELFLRSNRKVQLTAAGTTLFREVEAILKRTDEAKRATQRAARGEVGVLRIGFIAPAIAPILPPAVETYRRD